MTSKKQLTYRLAQNKHLIWHSHPQLKLPKNQNGPKIKIRTTTVKMKASKHYNKFRKIFAST